MDLGLEGGYLVARPVVKLTLADLLAEVTENTRHGEGDAGPCVGRESR